MALPGRASEAIVTRLLWREQLQALPRAVWSALRRLLRREPRWYLVIDGQVAARMVGDADHGTLLEWLATTHSETFRAGQQFGREVEDAVNGRQADPGDAGTA